MKAYLIPGWGEDLKDRNYKAVLDVYKQAGYQPEFVTVKWSYKDIHDWVEQVKSKIPKPELENSLLSGFSFGAMVSLILAAEYATPKKLILYSLSPYFAEDIPKLKPSWIKGIGQRKTKIFKKLPMEPLAKKVKCPTSIFVGKSEGPESEHRAREAHKIIKRSDLHVLEGVEHDVADPRYVLAMKDSLNT
jgi:alpha/beta superfamily hydrolase